MKPQETDEYSKLQVICSLFSKTVGDDLYFARQIKESIEATMPEQEAISAEPFIHKASELANELEGGDPSASIGVVSASWPDQSFSMLSLRASLLKAMKKTCRFEKGLVILTGLKEAICPKGRRWTQRAKREYEDAINFAREFCQQRSRPSSKMSLIIF